MKAAVYEGPQRLLVTHVPDPHCEPGGLVIRVEACAVCGTDLRAYFHGNDKIKPPRIVGHEMGGVVVEAGRLAEGLSPGDRVIVAPAIGCGQCRFCRSGHSNMCRSLTTIGFDCDGGFAEYLAVPAAAVAQGHVNRVPAGVGLDAAVLAEPLACCLNGQEPLALGLGDLVVVIGAGVIGCFHAALALLKGAAQVILADVDQDRLDLAGALLPVTTVINGPDGALAGLVGEASGGQGADAVIVACPVGAAQRQALELVRPLGRVSLFGGLPSEATAGFLDSNRVHYAGLGIFGAHASTALQNQVALELICRGKVPAEQYVTDTLPLDEIVRGIELARLAKRLKVVIKPWG